MVAFALLMTPFATNPLIYVASDPNYRRCPQIDTPNHLKAQTVINQRTNRVVGRTSSGEKYFRAYRDCLCKPLRRNSTAEVEALLHFFCIFTPILPLPGLDNPNRPPKCEALSGGARPPDPGHRDEQHPPGFFQSHLQDPHNLLLVCLSLFQKSSCIPSQT